MNTTLPWLVASVLSVFSLGGHAQSASSLPASSGAPAAVATPKVTAPYVVVQVGLDVPALEKLSHEAAQATRELADAVRTFAVAPNLTDDQKARAGQALQRVEELSSQLAQSVDRLPEAVRASGEPVLTLTQRIADEARWTMVTLAAGALLLLAGALAALYFLMLRPTLRMVHSVVGDFQSMAQALERSSELVAQANQAQLRLAATLAELTPAQPANAGATS